MQACSDVDWSAVWSEKFGRAMEVRETKDYYQDEGRARKYSQMSHLWVDGEERVAGFHLDPAWTAIDIGSGPGIMTVPMAKRCAKVTAVEPSPHMIQLLRERAAAEGLSNIDIVQARWEEADGLEPHDVVVASYCLLMPDIKAALLKMNKLARERVYIYWFAGTTYWERSRIDLYPSIHGRPHYPGPKVDVLFNVLYQLGIYPDIEVLDQSGAKEKAMGMEEALSDLRDLLMLPDRSHDRLLREYIETKYEPNGETFIRPDCTIRARLSWKPSPR